MTHYTWGERVDDPIILMNGSCIHLTRVRALCRRAVADADYPPEPLPAERPEGVCRVCWGVVFKDEHRQEKP